MSGYPRPKLMCATTAIIAAAALLGAACGGTGGSTAVKATDKDFAINLDRGSVNHGKLQFQVTNQGPSEHEMVVLKTDRSPTDLPVTDGKAEEDGEGVAHVDEIENVPAGQSETLNLNLDAGNYVLICNLPGHYSQGMRVAFTVQ